LPPVSRHPAGCSQRIEHRRNQRFRRAVPPCGSGAPGVRARRAGVAETVRRHEHAARQEQGYAPDEALGSLAQAAVHRTALRRALVEHGLLQVTSHLQGERIAVRGRQRVDGSTE
jgi:hypothetical protein